MTALLAMLKAKALWVALGAGSAAGLALLGKIIPKLISKYASQYLQRALDVRNPEDRELVKALVKWAEVKVPDRGAGKEKYDLVAAKLVSMLPVMKKHEDRISRLIENAVAAMDEELKKRAN